MISRWKFTKINTLKQRTIKVFEKLILLGSSKIHAGTL